MGYDSMVPVHSLFMTSMVIPAAKASRTFARFAKMTSRTTQCCTFLFVASGKTEHGHCMPLLSKSLKLLACGTVTCRIGGKAQSHLWPLFSPRLLG